MIALPVILIILAFAWVIGTIIWLGVNSDRYYRQSVIERMRAEEAEAALMVKHRIDWLYQSAINRVRR